MSISDAAHEQARRALEAKIQRQIAFAAGLFQGDITVRTLLESLAEGVVVTDSTGIILLANRAAERMFGYEPQELIGLPHTDLIPERFRDAHDLHTERYFTAPQTRPMGQFRDLVGRRRDGSEIPVEISLSFMNTAGGLLVLAFISDITPRKKYETHLQEKERLFRTQVECVKDYAIFMLDTDGRVLNWNAGAERLKGYREEEIVGQHFSRFYPAEDRQAGKPEAALATARRQGRFEDEGWRLRKDGSRFWADVIITPVYDESGSLLGYSKVTRDITERRRTQEEIAQLNQELAGRAAELEAANREMEAFNYTVAHDLRKPLTVINSYCQVLHEMCGAQLNDQSRKYLLEVYDGTCRMGQLIDALLNFAHLARVAPHLEEVDLSTMARALLEEQRQTEPDRRCRFLVAPDIKAAGDMNLVWVALGNLLGNAWKYTSHRDETVIEFGVTERDGEQVYFVRDNGIGFAMEETEKLFVPFQRLPGAAKFSGHGIGLATVARIVRRHGGRTWAEGEPDRGATFYFTLGQGEAGQKG